MARIKVIYWLKLRERAFSRKTRDLLGDFERDHYDERSGTEIILSNQFCRSGIQESAGTKRYAVPYKSQTQLLREGTVPLYLHLREHQVDGPIFAPKLSGRYCARQIAF